jgi:hypothetical protein
MTPRTPIALIFIAACALSTGATAQNVYKCGSTYSQTPCTDAQGLQIDDKRTAVQKQEADRATVRDATAARALEVERVQKERAAQEAANATAKADAARSKAQAQAQTKAQAKSAAQSRKKKQANFTAQSTDKPAPKAHKNTKKSSTS